MIELTMKWQKMTGIAHRARTADGAWAAVRHVCEDEDVDGQWA